MHYYTKNSKIIFNAKNTLKYTKIQKQGKTMEKQEKLNILRKNTTFRILFQKLLGILESVANYIPR